MRSNDEYMPHEMWKDVIRITELEASRLRLPQSDVDECVQNIMLRLISWDGVWPDSEGQQRMLIRKVLRNHRIDDARKAKLRKQLALAVSHETGVEAITDRGWKLCSTQNQIDHEVLMEALKCLHPVDRWVLESHFLRGLSLTALAAQAGVSKSTLSRIKAEAQQALSIALDAISSGNKGRVAEVRRVNFAANKRDRFGIAALLYLPAFRKPAKIDFAAIQISPPGVQKRA